MSAVEFSDGSRHRTVERVKIQRRAVLPVVPWPNIIRYQGRTDSADTLTATDRDIRLGKNVVQITGYSTIHSNNLVLVVTNN